MRRRARSWFLPTVAAGLLAALLLGGLLVVRDDDGETDPGALSELLSEDSGPVHVHGLGINPADGALFIATHTGLWRTPRGARHAELVGESRQDTMGFTVVGANHFLGSGHPDTTKLPPMLGLIESQDAGRTWKPISLLGEADFHVLRDADERLYGFDATNERLMVSRDHGRTWSEHRPPAPLIDLVAHPGQSSRIVAATQAGLFESRDGGAQWRQGAERVGLLAWARADRLYLVDGRGRMQVSPDERSQDGGASWTVRSTA